MRQDLQAPANGVDERKPYAISKLAWGLGILLLGVAAWLAAVHFRSATPVQTVRSSLLPPPHWSFLVNNTALSPDGTRLAFVGVGPNGENNIWVRSLSTGAEQEFAGTEGATVPFWSPDSTRLGFFADSKLKIVDANGGQPRVLAETTFGRGGTWNREGTIVYAPDMYGFLYRISETGGSPVAITKLPQSGGAQANRWPTFLPDGKHFLFSIDWSAPDEKPGNGIYVGSLDGGDPKLVTSEFTGNTAFASGKLIYVRDLTLTAQPFDPDKLQLTGPAAPVGVSQVVTNRELFELGFLGFRNGCARLSSSGGPRIATGLVQ